MNPATFAALSLSTSAVCLATSSPAAAADLTAGNVLVSNVHTGNLIEYTPTGSFVQLFDFPDFTGGFDDLRDIIVDPTGNVQAYNGTFTPQLSTLDPTTGAITSRPFTGWSTANNTSYGGIGAIDEWVFVTDMDTANAEPQGIVRFPVGAGTPTRFAEDSEFQDLTIGGDGLLYALRGNESGVHVYDPFSMTFVRSFNLDTGVRGIAVAANGLVYGASWDGNFYAYDADGNLLNTLDSGVSSLTDIDLNDNNQLLAGSRSGDVILTDTAFSTPTSFSVGSNDTIHVAFVETLTVPEPGSLTLLGLAGLATLRRRRR